MSPAVAFITSDADLLRTVTDLLSERGGRVVRVPPDATDVHADLVIVDAAAVGLGLPTLVARLKKTARPAPAVLILADRGGAEAAVAAVRSGADDVLFAPLDPLGLPARVDGLLHRQALEVSRENAKTLEFRNQELESFIYIVTHDMKTPVVNLQGLVNLVEQDHGPSLSEPVREYLVRLRRNAERLEELLRDLLEYPRRLRIVGPMEPHDSGEVAASAIDGLRELAAQEGVAVQLARDMPRVRCDAKRLQQVFHNLVENSIKHSKGRPSPTVDVGWSSTPRGPLFHVRDTGPGIPKDHIKDVFRLFHRIPGTSVDGSGIGLAVARQLVEAHGGEIWCESNVGEGTTFLFSLSP